MTSLLTEEHLAWIGHEESSIEVEISRNEIIKYAFATEQLQQKYVNGDVAPLMFVFNLFGKPQKINDLRPDGLPKRGQRSINLPLKRIMAGGTEIVYHRAIRPGDNLASVCKIVDLYEKTGRQGPLIFVVRERCVTDSSGEPVYTETQTSIMR